MLLPGQLFAWAQYFKNEGINAVFWSAVEEQQNVDSTVAEEFVSLFEDTQNDALVHLSNSREDLIGFLKDVASKHLEKESFVVGMVGYPNVGKSSTINKLVGAKKVSVSATPGKTRHLQTIKIDDQVCILYFISIRRNLSIYDFSALPLRLSGSCHAVFCIWKK